MLSPAIKNTVRGLYCRVCIYPCICCSTRSQPSLVAARQSSTSRRTILRQTSQRLELDAGWAVFNIHFQGSDFICRGCTACRRAHSLAAWLLQSYLMTIWAVCWLICT